MARTIQNNNNDLKAIKNNLALFLVDYFKDNLNINDNDDINILTIQKSVIFDKLKNDITAYLYGDNVKYKNDFDFALSYQLKHNNDFDISNDLKAIFDKTYKEQIKAIKEHQKAVEQVTINYYLADTLKSEIKRLIDYTKKRYKTTTRQAIEIINTDNVKQGLFEDVQADIKNFVGDNLSNDKIISLFNQEYKKAIKTIKEQTPKEQKSQKDTSKLIKAFLLIKKW